MLGTVVALVTSTGCIAEPVDEAEAAPLTTALGVQPNLPKPPPSVQSQSSKSGSSPTAKPSPVDDSSESDCPSADPEPSPWMPGDLPQEAHVK